MKWDKGRQKTGYYKKLLLQFPFKYFGGIDAYLLKMPEGAYLPVHRDIPCHFCKHYRLNIILKKAKIGGLFKCKNIIFNTDRIKLFKADEEDHSVTKIERGTRYVLSLGLAIFDKSVKYQ